MFFNKKTPGKIKELQIEVKELEGTVISLSNERKALKQEVEDLKLKKKIDEEDIKHMVKIKEERLEIEHKKKTLELTGEMNGKITEVKDQYRDKMEKFLEKKSEDLKEMYGEILKRLPEINVKLKGDV